MAPPALDEQIASANGRLTPDVEVSDRWFEDLERSEPSAYDDSMLDILKIDMFKNG